MKVVADTDKIDGLEVIFVGSVPYWKYFSLFKKLHSIRVDFFLYALEHR